MILGVNYLSAIVLMLLGLTYLGRAHYGDWQDAIISVLHYDEIKMSDRERLKRRIVGTLFLVWGAAELIFNFLKHHS